MFKCEVCGKVQNPGISETKVTVAIRSVQYPLVKREKETYIPRGHEIVKELTVCPACAGKEYDVTIVGEKILG